MLGKVSGSAAYSRLIEIPNEHRGKVIPAFKFTYMVIITSITW
jgi:hypothetical protein